MERRIKIKLHSIVYILRIEHTHISHYINNRNLSFSFLQVCLVFKIESLLQAPITHSSVSCPLYPRFGHNTRIQWNGCDHMNSNSNDILNKSTFNPYDLGDAHDDKSHKFIIRAIHLDFLCSDTHRWWLFVNCKLYIYGFQKHTFTLMIFLNYRISCVKLWFRLSVSFTDTCLLAELLTVCIISVWIQRHSMCCLRCSALLPVCGKSKVMELGCPNAFVIVLRWNWRIQPKFL